MTEQPTITHDTRNILAVNDAACELFGCDREWLVGRDFVSLFLGADMQGLEKLRLSAIRNRGALGAFPFDPFLFQFARCDETIFEATAQTRKINEGVYESVFTIAA